MRCIREPRDAQICQRCQGRGSDCIVQTYSSRRPRSPRLASRHRISQLESQVSSLSKAVRNIESKLGYQPSQISTGTPVQSAPTLGSDDSDGDSTNSDVLSEHAPSHLRSLFQNDWLSVDAPQQGEQTQERKGKVSSHLEHIARQALQELIPSKDEVSDIAKYASTWIVLLHSLLPQPYSVHSEQDILEAYDDMRKPDVDPMILASWLLAIALTGQQIPVYNSNSATQLKRGQRFPKELSDVIENTILPHDKMLCSIQGLGMALHFFRM